MNTVLIMVLLITMPNGTVIKQTTETTFETEAICKESQWKIINSPVPPHIELIGVRCETTGKI